MIRQLLLCGLAGILIVAADAVIKRQAADGLPFLVSLTAPLMWASYGLYFAQVMVAWWLFKAGELAIVANIFVVFYSGLSVLAGRVFFGESLTGKQACGVVLGVVAAILLSGEEKP